MSEITSKGTKYKFERDLSKKEKENNMYWCRRCQCYHSSNSEIGRAHRRFSGGQRRPRRKSFWDKFFE